MIYVIMILMGCYTGILAYKIGVNQRIELIPAVDEKILKRIKKKRKVSDAFGMALMLVTIACFATALLTYLFGKIGMYCGVVAIVIAAVNWATMQKDIELKIRTNKY